MDCCSRQKGLGTTWLCGQHFVSGRKSDGPLDPDYVPSIFNHVSSPMKRTMESKASDYHRRKGSKKRRIEEASRQRLAKESREVENNRKEERRKKLAKEAERKQLEEIRRERHEAEVEQRKAEQMRRARELEEQRSAEIVRQLEELKAGNEALKKSKEELISKCTSLEQQLSEVTKDKKEPEEKVAALSKQILSEATMKEDAKKVKYFTGLPSFAVLKAIYNLAAKELQESADFPLFQQFLITLVKLRLNVGDLDLARFGISQASV